MRTDGYVGLERVSSAAIRTHQEGQDPALGLQFAILDYVIAQETSTFKGT